MAQNYDIQMTKFNGTDYDNLYPKTRVDGTSGNLVSLNSSGELQDSGKNSDSFDSAGAASNVQTNLNSHTSDKNNPHAVTKAQVGLGNVDNTSDLNKPISTAVQTALNAKANSSHNHSAANITSGILPVARGGTGVSSLEALASAFGAVKFEYGSYEGTGTHGYENQQTITFSFTPKVWGFMGRCLKSHPQQLTTYGYFGMAPWGMTEPKLGALSSSSPKAVITASYENNKVSWYAGSSANQNNYEDYIYYYFAIG